MSSAPDAIQQAALLIAQADSLVITAGAGMGVDSGLPDFRGPNGFWNAYPALGRAQIAFEEIASPHFFERDPMLAWGFYGHRLKLYRETIPHAGFAQLLAIARHLAHGAFVVTSNVDGQFQKAGFDESRVLEVHGSIHHMQCLNGCGGAIVGADGFLPELDVAACRLTSELPRCPNCGDVMRPNVLMFDDGGWLARRCSVQERAFRDWHAAARRPVVIEFGAGTRIPTIRLFGERQRCPLIRINKTEAQVPREGDISLPLGAAEAIRAISKILTASHSPQPPQAAG